MWAMLGPGPAGQFKASERICEPIQVSPSGPLKAVGCGNCTPSGTDIEDTARGPQPVCQGLEGG